MRPDVTVSGSFLAKSGALIWTPNSGALITRTPQKKDRQSIETPVWILEPSGIAGSPRSSVPGRSSGAAGRRLAGPYGPGQAAAALGSRVELLELW